MANYSDNLIGGLAMYMAGPLWARLALRTFVVFTGFLILAGAVNTAIVGSVGVLTRVAEDGVMLDWFRNPHKRYGTNYRIVNLVAGLQIATIVMSRGDMYVLGEAYAFGVVWSFVFKSLSVLMLRYREKYKRLWRMPLNLTWFRPGGQDFPLGLALTFLVLLAIAIVNLFTKQVATIWGVSFTAGLFIVFSISERINGQVPHEYGEEPEKFNLHIIENGQPLDIAALGIDGHARKLIAIRDPHNLAHLHRYLSEHDDADLIALTVRNERGFASSEGAQPFTAEEGTLFSKVVKVCEDHGRPVTPLVVVSNDQQFAIANTAFRLGVDEVVMGVSAKFSPDVQLEKFRDALGIFERRRASREGPRPVRRSRHPGGDLRTIVFRPVPPLQPGSCDGFRIIAMILAQADDRDRRLQGRQPAERGARAGVPGPSFGDHRPPRADPRRRADHPARRRRGRRHDGEPPCARA